MITKELVNEYFCRQLDYIYNHYSAFCYHIEGCGSEEFYDEFCSPGRSREKQGMANSSFTTIAGMTRSVFLFSDEENEEIASHYVLKVNSHRFGNKAANYNKSEYDMFQTACDRRMQGAFAECWFLEQDDGSCFDFSSDEFLIMERAEVDEDSFYISGFREYQSVTGREVEDNSREYWDAYNDFRDLDDIDIVFYVFAPFYGDCFTEELVGMPISDIHSGNVGFLADGTPVIIDYAGFSI